MDPRQPKIYQIKRYRHTVLETLSVSSWSCHLPFWGPEFGIFLWGFLKSLVRQTSLQQPKHLRLKVNAASTRYLAGPLWSLSAHPNCWNGQKTKKIHSSSSFTSSISRCNHGVEIISHINGHERGKNETFVSRQITYAIIGIGILGFVFRAYRIFTVAIDVVT